MQEEFGEFIESDKSFKQKIGVNLKILSLTCVLLVSWSLTQEVAGLNSFTGMTIIFVTEFAQFSKTFKENSIVLPFG